MIPAGVRIWAAAAPVDMRRGFVGLAEVARERLAQDPASGALFFFRNRKTSRNVWRTSGWNSMRRRRA